MMYVGVLVGKFGAQPSPDVRINDGVLDGSAVEHLGGGSLQGLEVLLGAELAQRDQAEQLLQVVKDVLLEEWPRGCPKIPGGLTVGGVATQLCAWIEGPKEDAVMRAFTVLQ